MSGNKIGILTLPISCNYGWALQLWALYTFLNQKGFQVVILNRRWNDASPTLLKNVLRFIYDHTLRWPFFRFVKELKSTPIVRDSSSLKQIVESEHIDTLIVGSDQVWRIEYTRDSNLDFFCGFLSNSNIKKISYAASFGTDLWMGKQSETDQVKALLKEFKLVTVRESSGVDICREIFQINAYHAIDPTMLIDVHCYDTIMADSPRRSPFLAYYFLDITPRKKDLAESVCKRYSVDGYSLMPSKRTLLPKYRSVAVWLSSIKNASYVITDSFHGMVFCILFGKQFVVMSNTRRGNTRFDSLLRQLGLLSRVVTEDMPLDMVLAVLGTHIDYENVFELIERLRNKSQGMLLSAI